jgi:YbgC/YbaW family acyl-CoA thioester hydrolase
VTPRFFEVDRAGIVFFSRVFEFCHATYEELFMSIDCGVDRLIERDGLGMPLVHVEADFKRPMRMGEVLDIGVEVERLTARSIAFRYTLRGADAVVRATVLHVHAFVAFDALAGGEAPAEGRRSASVEAPAVLLEGLREAGVLAAVEVLAGAGAGVVGDPVA